ncbi:MAG: signal peptidase I [Clostridia bacterium]|nr:signal peptidase I [Clostridia bacterium]
MEEKVEQVNKKENKGSMLFDFASVVMTGIIAIAVVFTFFFRTATVSGWSMFPTLNHGDMLMVTAFDNTHEAGDIVVVTQPNAFNEPLIKRIIAVGGQTVDIDFDKGVVYIDGVAENPEYTLASPTNERENFNGPVTIPEGFVFVMGDNRNSSSDSRSNAVGLIDERYIYGTVLGRISPAGSWDVI